MRLLRLQAIGPSRILASRRIRRPSLLAHSRQPSKFHGPSECRKYSTLGDSQTILEQVLHRSISAPVMTSGCLLHQSLAHRCDVDMPASLHRLYRPTAEYVTRIEPKQASRASKFLSSLSLKPVSPVAKVATAADDGASGSRDVAARKSISSVRAKLSSSVSSSSVNRVQPDRNAAITSPSSITSFESAIDDIAYAASAPATHNADARQQEPPTMSPKALDVLIGLPPSTAPKAVSTLTGPYSRPSVFHRMLR